MNLHVYIETNGLTASAFADRAKVPVQCVTRFLRGERGVSPQMAAKMSAGSGGEVSVEEILFPDGLPENARLAESAK
jgi:plasmid maintenance system antidote protein VapI